MSHTTNYSMFFHLSSKGWKIGPLVTVVPQKHSLTSPILTWIKNMHPYCSNFHRNCGSTRWPVVIKEAGNFAGIVGNCQLVGARDLRLSDPMTFPRLYELAHISSHSVLLRYWVLLWRHRLCWNRTNELIKTRPETALSLLLSRPSVYFRSLKWRFISVLLTDSQLGWVTSSRLTVRERHTGYIQTNENSAILSGCNLLSTWERNTLECFFCLLEAPNYDILI
jgi:hypothetical protein